MPKVQGMSLVPIFLEMFFESTSLAIGSAFIHRRNKKYFLVTARHNFTGQDSETGANLHKGAGRPDRVRAWLPKEEIGEWVEQTWPLVTDGTQLWWGHPKHGSLVDVAVLQIDESPDTAIRTVLSKETAPDLSVYAGAEVFVLGYPAGLTASKKFPIWKRGTIASEPELDVDDLPKFLIDTATYKGMSGSAVYAATSSIYVSEAGIRVITGGSGVLHSRFIGMYSGRLNSKNGSSNDDLKRIDPATQIGIVWKRAVIDEIIDSAK